MAISQNIDSDLGVIFLEIESELRDENVGRWSDAVRADPNCRPGIKRLADFSGVTKLNVTTHGIERLATAARGFDPLRRGRRLAIVVSGCEADQGSTRGGSLATAPGTRGAS